MKFDSKLYGRGIRDGIPIFLGYMAVSFSFGIQAKKMGMSLFDASILSLTNLTSAGQFSGLTLIYASSTIIEIAITQLIINSRYLLMSSALSQKLSPEENLSSRLIMAHGVTDEIFGISISQKGMIKPSYVYGLMSAAIPGWVLGTALGVISGDLLPVKALDALSMALYGMLIAIIIPPAKKDKILSGIIIISMLSSYLFERLEYLKSIPKGASIIILTVLITTAAAVFFPNEGDEI
ncbi:MAG: AzlC family ABC transporter permease [Tissierellia bacterium]|nr:AzlC family ABC transporter permease [Tissierellia bacterium]